MSMMRYGCLTFTVAAALSMTACQDDKPTIKADENATVRADKKNKSVEDASPAHRAAFAPGKAQRAGSKAAVGAAARADGAPVEAPSRRSKMSAAEVEQQRSAWADCGDSEQPRLCMARARAAEPEEDCGGDTLCERRNLARQQARSRLAEFETDKQHETDEPTDGARPKLTPAELAQRQAAKKQCGFDKNCHLRKLAAEADEVCGDDFECHERNRGRERARQKQAQPAQHGAQEPSMPLEDPGAAEPHGEDDPDCE